MGFYDDLGVHRIINASTTFTALGGTLMPPEVLDAMREASGSFVDMHQLHAATGHRIAELTGNEAAHVTSGCAAAIVLAVLACRTGDDPRLIERMPHAADLPDEVIMHTAHRMPYDPALRLAGARIRQIGNAMQTFGWELEAAINEHTAAILYVAGGHLEHGSLPLPEVVRIAREHKVPVIVDAAAQLPPVTNLWHFTREVGADLALFSGGKALHGPQASGLMVGRADLIEAARQNSSPHQRLARAMKAGKEEIAGLVAAVDRYVHLDHDEIARGWYRTVEEWRTRLGSLTGITVEIESTNEAGQPVPRLRVEVGSDAPVNADTVIRSLREGEPAIAVLPYERAGVPLGFWLSPDLLAPGEAETITTEVQRRLAV